MTQWEYATELVLEMNTDLMFECRGAHNWELVAAVRSHGHPHMIYFYFKRPLTPAVGIQDLIPYT